MLELTRTQKLLLQAAIFRGDAACHAWQEWTAAIDLDTLDPVSITFLPLVSRNPDLPNGPILDKCKGAYRKNWVTNHLLWQRTEKLFSILNLPVVVLKGMAMILHHYRDFGIRVIGDVDFLIAHEDVVRTDALLQAQGLKPNLQLDLKNPQTLKRRHSLNYETLDLHWSFLLENSRELDLDVWETKIPVKDNLFVPDATELLLQTCVHGMKKNAFALIRWIPDACKLLESPIDWNRLTTLASTVHVRLPLLHAFQYLNEHFDQKIPEFVLTTLQSSSYLHLEELEHKANLQGRLILAEWHRYCLNRNRYTMLEKLSCLPYFLQETARLSSVYYIPFFAPYWVLKQLKKRGIPWIKNLNRSQ